MRSLKDNIKGSKNEMFCKNVYSVNKWECEQEPPSQTEFPNAENVIISKKTSVISLQDIVYSHDVIMLKDKHTIKIQMRSNKQDIL